MTCSLIQFGMGAAPTVPAPTLDALPSPLLVSAGSTRTFSLTGEYLTGASVTVGGSPATGVTVDATGQTVTFTTPALAYSTTTAGYAIVVTTTGGSATLNSWLGAVGSGAVFSVHTDFTAGWFAPEWDPIGFTWTDLVGGVVLAVPGFSSGNPFLQPGWGGGQPALSFTGDLYLQNTAHPTLAQPFSVVSVFSTVESNNYQVIWASGTSTTVAGILDTGTRHLWIQAAGNGTQTTYAASATPTENEFVVDGASSSIDQNGSTPAGTANPGSNAMTGLTLGSYYSAQGFYFDGYMGLLLTGANISANARANAHVIAQAIFGTA